MQLTCVASWRMTGCLLNDHRSMLQGFLEHECHWHADVGVTNVVQVIVHSIRCVYMLTLKIGKCYQSLTTVKASCSLQQDRNLHLFPASHLDLCLILQLGSQ